MEELNTIADRVYTLIRAFWVRELGEKWSYEMDYRQQDALKNR